jgi:hypothetical protein
MSEELRSHLRTKCEHSVLWTISATRSLPEQQLIKKSGNGPQEHPAQGKVPATSCYVLRSR